MNGECILAKLELTEEIPQKLVNEISERSQPLNFGSMLEVLFSRVAKTELRERLFQGFTFVAYKSAIMFKYSNNSYKRKTEAKRITT